MGHDVINLFSDVIANCTQWMRIDERLAQFAPALGVIGYATIRSVGAITLSMALRR